MSATASDNAGLATIKLWGNGAVFGTISCSGTTCAGTVTWITGPLAPGAYQVQAVATDSTGNCAVSAPVTINKNGTSPAVPSGAPACGGGAGDTTPPAIAITSPASGVWTGNSINVSATARDNVGIATIKLWGNGRVFGTLTCSETACSGTVTWITGPLPSAAYQVQAVATDVAGNCAVSAPVTVYKNGTSPTVASGAPPCSGGGGGGDTTPPTASIASPPSGVWTGNSINVSASATDTVGLATIKLWGNGGVFGTLTCGGTTCSGTVTWITGALPPGAYQVQAVATDGAGNTANSTAITIYKDGTAPVVASGAP